MALASANFCSGYRIDLEAIGALCAERGVLFSVDAIQTLGAFPIALDRIDFLSAGAQKWMLGPSGAGILYVKKSRRDLLRPTTIGGWNVRIAAISLRNARSITPGRPEIRAGRLLRTAQSPDWGPRLNFFWKLGRRRLASGFSPSRRRSSVKLTPAGFEFLSPKEENNRSGILTFRHPRIPTDRFFEALLRNQRRRVTALRSRAIAAGCGSARIFTTPSTK